MKKARWLSVAFGLASCCMVSPAAADVSSWAYVGAGAADLKRSSASTTNINPMALQLDAGFGSAPTGPVVVGFAAKAWTFWGHGTDLGLALRFTSVGYSLGDWGVAVDLGATQRFWGETATLASPSLNFGLPWGLTLAATAASDFGNNQSLIVSLGFDWARLTVHRVSGNDWWRNYRLPVVEHELAKR